jgi:hypothetical protein
MYSSVYIIEFFCLPIWFEVEDATDHFLILSPFEMKTLLHMIISGKELNATSGMASFAYKRLHDIYASD